LGHTEEECWKKNPALRPRQKSNPQPVNEVNVMETYEFSNIGVDRHYDEHQPSDASINTQFDVMELEDSEVSLIYEQLFNQNEITNLSLATVMATLICLQNKFLNNNKLKVLLDSGASSSIIYENRLPTTIAAKLKRKQTPTVWTTNTGTFTTNKEIKQGSIT